MDFVNFVNDNTHYTSKKNTNELIESLEKFSNTLFQWLKDNRFKRNSDECHLIVITNQKTNVKIRKLYIENSDCEKLLWTKIDTKLTFDCHVSES